MFIVAVFQADPVLALNFTPIMFVPHVALDSYAFLESDMFEFLPGTRRAGERTAIEDPGAPVFIVDTDGRVVTLNAAARRVTGYTEAVALTEPLSEVLGTDVNLTDDEQRRTITVDGQRREFLVTPASLDDLGGSHVGYTLVFQDITDSVRREQRLTVMNRVLRHNLRNDLNVVQGCVEASAERVENEEVDLSGLLDAVAADVREAHVGTVEVEVPEATTVYTDPEVLALILENLLENALLHGGDAPRVTVTAERVADAVEITVTDDGPGIPAHEPETIESGTETDLVHGSGMGMWVVDWGVDRLGGRVAFDSGDGGDDRHAGAAQTGRRR